MGDGGRGGGGGKGFKLKNLLWEGYGCFLEQCILIRYLAFGGLKLFISAMYYKNSVTLDLVKFSFNLACEHRWVSSICFAEDCDSMKQKLEIHLCLQAINNFSISSNSCRTN